MLIIHCAFMAEAKPIISNYRLKRDLRVTAFELYQTEGLQLIISGIGALRTAAALSYLIARLEAQEITVTKLLNFGFAGATADFEIGELVQINQVSNWARDRSVFPENLTDYRLRQAKIISAEAPVTSDAGIAKTLVDMEGFAFAGTAQLFYKNDQYELIKIVADHLTGDYYSQELIEELIRKNESVIYQIIDHNLAAEVAPHAIGESSVLLEEIAADLKLSAQETRQLTLAAEQYQINCRRPITEFMQTYHYKVSPHKKVNQASFQKLLLKLKIEVGKMHDH